MGFIFKIIGKIHRRILQYYRRAFQRRNYIYVHNGQVNLRNSDDYEIRRYSQYKDIPENIVSSILENGGSEALESDKKELDQAAIMWVVLVENKLATVLFTRKGENFKNWFVDLENDDFVIFRVRTYPQYRGQGIAPFLMLYVMKEGLKLGDKAYIDCRIYNKASIRAIQKAGFECIGAMKPISRKYALGE